MTKFSIVALCLLFNLSCTGVENSSLNEESYEMDDKVLRSIDLLDGRPSNSFFVVNGNESEQTCRNVLSSLNEEYQFDRQGNPAIDSISDTLMYTTYNLAGAEISYRMFSATGSGVERDGRYPLKIIDAREELGGFLARLSITVSSTVRHLLFLIDRNAVYFEDRKLSAAEFQEITGQNFENRIVLDRPLGDLNESPEIIRRMRELSEQGIGYNNLQYLGANGLVANLLSVEGAPYFLLMSANLENVNLDLFLIAIDNVELGLYALECQFRANFILEK